MDLTDIERKVIDILIRHEPTPAAYSSPIHEVDRATDLTTKETLALVKTLIDRNLLHVEAAGGSSRLSRPAWVWREGPP